MEAKMQIDETQFPVKPAWEGRLVSPAGKFAAGEEKLPRVSIGQPEWWSNIAPLAENWTAPAGGRQYGLARFAFSLRPERGQEVRKAELMVVLDSANGGEKPITFDLLPKAVNEEQTGTFAISLSPGVKFSSLGNLGSAEASLGKAEYTIPLRQALPVISADGIGESHAHWVFSFHKARTLTGSQLTYAIIGLPQGASAARATLHLKVEIAGRLGPFGGIFPEEARDRLSWVLGQGH
jgi:hypothetical protein